MNKKGFTLVELLATLVILGIVVGFTIIGVNYNINNTKKKTEKIFIGTIKDAIKIYLDSDPKDDNNNKLDYSIQVCTINKTLNDSVNVYKADNNITLNTIINSKYSPLLESDLVNPNNEEAECNLDASVNIYRDDDYVYYYKVSKRDIECLTLDLDEYITNLPDGCNG